NRPGTPGSARHARFRTGGAGRAGTVPPGRRGVAPGAGRTPAPVLPRTRAMARGIGRNSTTGPTNITRFRQERPIPDGKRGEGMHRAFRPPPGRAGRGAHAGPVLPRTFAMASGNGRTWSEEPTRYARICQVRPIPDGRRGRADTVPPGRRGVAPGA